MHASAFSPETKNRPLKKIKISPKSWGILKSFFRGLVATFGISDSHKTESAVWGLLA